MPHESGNTTYYSCAETAKLVRAALARAYPGVKFSVRSRTYANGASIDVETPKGGPDVKAVRRVVEVYSGSGFDGMIDMAWYRDAFMDDAGIVRGVHDPGTEGSRGSVPARIDSQPAGTRRVHFGANHVFVQEAY